MALAGWGCGGNEEGDQTPYGSAEEVRQYRQRLEPIIQAINAVEVETDSAAVGSSGQATAANLARVYARVRPSVQQALEALEQLVPPPLLAPLHREIKQALLLRLSAYDAVLQGWVQQQEQGESEQSAALYRQAEEALASAKALLAQVNAELEKVDLALGESAGGNPLAA